MGVSCSKARHLDPNPFDEVHTKVYDADLHSDARTVPDAISGFASQCKFASSKHKLWWSKLHQNMSSIAAVHSLRVHTRDGAGAQMNTMVLAGHCDHPQTLLGCSTTGETIEVSHLDTLFVHTIPLYVVSQRPDGADWSKFNMTLELEWGAPRAATSATPAATHAPSARLLSLMCIVALVACWNVRCIRRCCAFARSTRKRPKKDAGPERAAKARGGAAHGGATRGGTLRSCMVRACSSLASRWSLSASLSASALVAALGVVLSSGGWRVAPLARVERITERQLMRLSDDDLLSTFLERDEPLLIELDDESRRSVDVDGLRSSLGECAGLSLGKDDESTAHAAASLRKSSFGRAFWWAFGERALALRSAAAPTAYEFGKRVSSAPWPPDASSTFSRLRTIRHQLLRLGAPTPLVGVLFLLEAYATPLYMADQSLHSVCNSAVRALVPQHLSTVEARLAAIIARRPPTTAEPPTAEPMAKPPMPEPTKLQTRLFWGAPGSYSYPTHVDLMDGDLFFRVLDGGKHFALYEAHADEALLPLRFMGPAWSMNEGRRYGSGSYGRAGSVFAFDSLAAQHSANAPLAAHELPAANEPLAVGPAGYRGWAHTLRRGYTLYVPGHLPHHVVNVDHGGTLGLCTRPWTAKQWRAIREYLKAATKPRGLRQAGSGATRHG